MSNGKFEYLGMIQSTIERMSATSSILKGFAATVVTGISAVSFTGINNWVLLLSFIPVLSFLALDIYYLQLERKYRFLYDQIRLDKHEINFDLALKNHHIDRVKAKATIWGCLKSPSIWLFYFPVTAVAIIITVLKFMEVL